MFGRYNINDLFLASILVLYSDDDALIEGRYYGNYLTILRKNGDKYIDLQDMSRNITTTVDLDSIATSYTINYIEPLSKYYTQEGKRKDTFSRKKALTEAKKYYNEFTEKLKKDEWRKEASYSYNPYNPDEDLFDSIYLQ